MAEDTEGFSVSTAGVFSDAVEMAVKEAGTSSKGPAKQGGDQNEDAEPESEDLEGEDAEEEGEDEEPEGEEDDSEGEGEDDDEEEESEDEDEEDDSDDSDKKGRKSAKKHTLTLPDGSQVKVTDDTTFKIKVDGRFQRVSLQDLTSNYNGQIKHDELIRRSSEKERALNERLVATERQERALKESVQNISEHITQGNVMHALSLVAKMKKESPEEIMDAWIKGLDTFLSEWTGLSDADREAKVKKYRLESELAELEQKKRRLSQEEETQQTNAAIERACRENALTLPEVQVAYEAMMHRRAEQEKAGMKPPEFTLKDVVATALDFQVLDGVLQAAQSLKVNLESQDKSYLVAVVRAEQQKNGTRLGPSDYRKLIKAYAKNEIESLSRKVPKQHKATTPKRKKGKERELTRASQIWE